MKLSKHKTLSLPHPVSKVKAVSFHPYTPSVCLGSANEIYEYDLITSSLKQTIYLEGPVSHILHSRISPQLLCFLQSGSLVIYDLLTNQYQGAYIPVSKRQKGRFSFVEICPTRPVVYFCRHKGNRLFELNYEKNVNNRKKLTSVPHRRRITALTVHPKGHGVFTGQLDGIVRYINARRATLLEFVEGSGRIITKEAKKEKRPGGSMDPVSVIRFGPYPQKDSTVIITATRRGMLRVWQLKSVRPPNTGKGSGSGAGRIGFRVICLSQCSLGQNKWIRNIIFPFRFPFPCCLTEKGEVMFFKTNHVMYSAYSNPYASTKRTLPAKPIGLDTLPRSFIRPFYVAADLSAKKMNSRSKHQKRELIQMDVHRISGDIIFYGGSKSSKSPSSNGSGNSSSSSENMIEEITLYNFQCSDDDSSYFVSLPQCSVHHHLLVTDFINSKGVLACDHPKIFYFDRVKAFPNILAVEHPSTAIGQRELKGKNRQVITTLIVPDASQENRYYRLFRTKYSRKKDVMLLFFQSEAGRGLGWVQFLSKSRTTVGGMKSGRDGAFYDDVEEAKLAKDTSFLVLDVSGKKLVRYPEGSMAVFEEKMKCSILRIFYIHHPRNQKSLHNDDEDGSDEENEGEGEDDEEDVIKTRPRKDFKDIPLMYYESESHSVVKSDVGNSINPDFSDPKCSIRLDEKEKLLDVFPQNVHTAILTNRRLVIVETKKMNTVISEFRSSCDNNNNNNEVLSCLWAGNSLLFYNTQTTLYCIQVGNAAESVCTMDFSCAVLVDIWFDRIIFAYFAGGKNLVLGYRYVNLFDILIRHLPEVFFKISKVLDLPNTPIKPLPIVSNPQLRNLVSKRTMEILLEKGQVNLVNHLFSQSRYRMNDWTFKFKILIHQLEFEKCYELLVQKFRLSTSATPRMRGSGGDGGASDMKKQGDLVMKRFRVLGNVCLDYKNYEFAYLCYRKINDLMSLFTLYATTKNLEGMAHLSSQLAQPNKNKNEKSAEKEEEAMLKKMCEMFSERFGKVSEKEEESEGEEEGTKNGEEDEQDKIKNYFPKSVKKVDAIHQEWSQRLVSPKETLPRLPLSFPSDVVSGGGWKMKKKKTSEEDDEEEDESTKKRQETMTLEVSWLRPELLRNWLGCSFTDYTSPLSRTAVEGGGEGDSMPTSSSSIRGGEIGDAQRSISPSPSLASSTTNSQVAAGGGPKGDPLSRPEDALPEFGAGSTTDPSGTMHLTEEEETDDDELEEEGEDDDESETDTASIAGSEASSVISQAQSEPSLLKSNTKPPSRNASHLQLPGKGVKKRSITPNALPSQEKGKLPIRGKKGKNNKKGKKNQKLPQKVEIIQPPKKGGGEEEEERKRNLADDIEAEGEKEMKKYEWSSDSSEDEGDEREAKINILKKIRIKEVVEVDEEEQEKKLSEFSFGPKKTSPESLSSSQPEQPSTVGRRRGRRGRRLQQLQEMDNNGETTTTKQSLVSKRLRKKLGVKNKTKTRNARKLKGKATTSSSSSIITSKNSNNTKGDETVRKIERQIKRLGKVEIWQMVQRLLNNPMKYQHAYVVCSYLVRDVLSLDETEIRERKRLIPAVKCLLYLKLIMHINKLKESSSTKTTNDDNMEEIAFLSYHLSCISQLGESVTSKSREISIEMNLKAQNFAVCASQIEEKMEFAFDDEETKALQEKLKVCEGKGNKDKRLDIRKDDDDNDNVLYCWETFKSFDSSKDPFWECTYCSAKYLESELEIFEKCMYCKYGSLEKNN